MMWLVEWWNNIADYMLIFLSEQGQAASLDAVEQRHKLLNLALYFNLDAFSSENHQRHYYWIRLWVYNPLSVFDLYIFESLTVFFIFSGFLLCFVSHQVEAEWIYLKCNVGYSLIHSQIPVLYHPLK